MKTTVQGLDKWKQATGKDSVSGCFQLRSFLFKQVSEIPPFDFSIWITLEKDSEGAIFQIEMVFTGIQCLSLKDFGGSITQISGFDVKEISFRQMEGINFEIYDFEDDRIQFFARTAEILSVERQSPTLEANPRV